MFYWDLNVDVLLGKTLTRFEVNNADDEIAIETEDGLKYRMYHDQNCCESVSIDDIAGNLEDLIGSPITMAECVINNDPVEGVKYQPDSHTWTFYKFATLKGYVTIRWFGESNGYYSEEVDFVEVK